MEDTWPSIAALAAGQARALCRFEGEDFRRPGEAPGHARLSFQSCGASAEFVSCRQAATRPESKARVVNLKFIA
jgi:hypothetical protein